MLLSSPQVSSALFFQYNEALRPPYSVLVDTNFINFSIQKKLELVQAMMDCLYAKATPCITDCVMAELEKLGPKYRLALRIARDPRFERIKCDHKGTYADDCLVNRVMQHKCYIVATNDRDLKRRIRKIPGVPIMTCGTGKWVDLFNMALWRCTDSRQVHDRASTRRPGKVIALMVTGKLLDISFLFGFTLAFKRVVLSRIIAQVDSLHFTFLGATLQTRIHYKYLFQPFNILKPVKDDEGMDI